MLSSTALRMAVACRNLTKEFGDGDEKVMALRGVNVDVPPGEVSEGGATVLKRSNDRSPGSEATPTRHFSK